MEVPGLKRWLPDYGSTAISNSVLMVNRLVSFRRKQLARWHSMKDRGRNATCIDHDSAIYRTI